MYLTNKPYLFGFVRFLKERDAMNAISKNNGLTIRGLKMSVVMAKYTTSEEDKHANLKRL